MSNSALQYYKIANIVQNSVQKLHSIETTKKKKNNNLKRPISLTPLYF